MFFNLLIILVLAIMPVEASAQGILAFGDLRGHIEPCGCDPATDLGGIKRLASFLARERQFNMDVVVVSLGNLASAQGPDLKSKYIQKAVAELKPDVMLANYLELKAEDRVVLESLSKIPLVLTNQAKLKTGLRVSPLIERAGKTFFGYVSPRHPFFSATQHAYELVDWRDKFFMQKILKVAKDKRVLLFSGSADELSEIKSAGLFAEIISSSLKPLSALPGKEERDQEESLKVSKDPEIWAVPLGGTGVVRLGKAQVEIPPKVRDILSGSATLQDEIGSIKLAKKLPISWLGKDTELAPSLVDDLYSRYQLENKNELIKLSKARERDIANSDFVGNSVCTACHLSAYEIHAKSKHAEAFETLKKKKKEFDSECIGCHVVGFAEKGGFVSEEKTPQLVGVQCEACHGKRRDHIRDPKIKSDVKVNCEACHNSQHSPSFERKSYWERIKHARD